MGSPELVLNVGCRLSIDQPGVVCAAGVAGVSNHAPPRVALLGKPAVAHGHRQSAAASWARCRRHIIPHHHCTNRNSSCM